MKLPENDASALKEEAERFRTSLGRPGTLTRLFDFLLDRSLAGEIPREVEIAQDVFGRTDPSDLGQDASVRVYIHRLRAKMADYYEGALGPRLSCPKGEYRIVLMAASTPIDLSPPPVASKPKDFLSGVLRNRSTPWIAIGLVAVANATAWIVSTTSQPSDARETVRRTSFWQQLAGNGRPTVVVTGDYYIYGDAPDTIQVTRLVRQFSINSREDLDEYLIKHPEDRKRFVDVDLHYLPTSAAPALVNVLPLINAAAATPNGKQPSVMAASELTPDALKAVNIVYIGFFSGLGMLRDPLFGASGFKVGSSYDELVDRASGKRFTSDWSNVTENQERHRDYAYVASLPGASGNRVLVVAGTRDAGVMQAAEIAKDRGQLERLSRLTGNRNDFEALYEVSTLGNVDLRSRLVLARPLHPRSDWKGDLEDTSFPDQTVTSDLAGGTER